MDKTHYERRSHEQGNYEIIPTYKGQVVVTIKSLATGQTMQVYLDEPTQEVREGVNATTYTGHFYEDEFMVTWSEGIEITGLPLMYPYNAYEPIDGQTIIIDTQNHSIIIRNSNSFVSEINLALSPGIDFAMQDIPYSETLPTSGNAVLYTFTRPSGTSEEPGLIPAEPVSPVEGGTTPIT